MHQHCCCRSPVPTSLCCCPSCSVDQQPLVLSCLQRSLAAQLAAQSAEFERLRQSQPPQCSSDQITNGGVKPIQPKRRLPDWAAADLQQSQPSAPCNPAPQRLAAASLSTLGPSQLHHSAAAATTSSLAARLELQRLHGRVALHAATQQAQAHATVTAAAAAAAAAVTKASSNTADAGTTTVAASVPQPELQLAGHEHHDGSQVRGFG